VRVWVNQLEWKEVRSFYGQPSDAKAFITHEDEQGKTHVVFGDGQNGARLPTGVNNVVASYRYGSGAEAPAAGSLTVVLQPQPGLRAVRNPVPVGGGADPDPPDKVRQQAPRSVLTFNRAVSIDDYEVIAAQAPGVVRAKAAVAFDPLAQRPRITVWVGDDQGAVDAAKAAFAATADPNRLPNVVAAKARVLTLSLTIVFEPRREPKTVLDAVHNALVYPDKGLFGVNVVHIGEVFYDSQVYAACLAVPGVVAVHSLNFSAEQALLDSLYVRSAALKVAIGIIQKALPAVPAKTAWISAAPPGCCGQRHDPGEGAYLFLPDDTDHLILAQEVAS
jgi:predicted phage baseplate assembly protein